MNSISYDPTVRHRFSAAAASYDRHADAQRLAADHLLTCLPEPGSVRSILEAGCGTGYLTRALAIRFPHASLDALDLSATMVETARGACPTPERVRWHVSDLGHYQAGHPVDLLASNAALHWIEPQQAAFSAAHRLVRPGGIIACSLMVHGTLRELHHTRRDCVPDKPPQQRLPDPEGLRSALAETHFDVQHFETRSYRTRHPSARHFLTALHDMGLTGGSVSRAARPLNRGELERVAACYQARFGSANGEVYATYKVAFFRATRTG